MAKLYGAVPPLTVITAFYALPTVAGGKCADIAIGCAGLLLALEGVPTLSKEHALVRAIND